GRRSAENSAMDRRNNLWLFVAETFFPPNDVEREIFGGLRDPSGWIFWNPIVGPRPQRLHQRLLDRVLRQLQPVDPKNPRQDRNQLPGFFAEKPVRQPRHHRGWR